MGDTYSPYEIGVQRLLEQLGPTHSRYGEALILQQRLQENVANSRVYGDTETRRAERFQVLGQLNALSLAALGLVFNDLCRESAPVIPPPAESEIVELLRRIEAKIDDGHVTIRQDINQVLDAIDRHQLEQSEATGMVAELRAWSQEVQASGLPLNPELRAALAKLSEHTGSAYQYLQLAVPIIPGILTYNVELGSQHQLDLKALWEKIKSRLRKKGPGVSAGPADFLGQGSRWAVLVGVNEYEDQRHYGRLHVCAKDVEATRELLVAGGFDPQRIRLLTDGTAEPPTRANIVTVLQSVAAATEPHDLLLFYYSGHGEERDGESYLVARDGRMLSLKLTGVPVSAIKETMEGAAARAKVIILDACHSGADLGGKGPRRMSAEFIQRVFAEAEGLAILASCKQGELSYEWQDQERSVFTHYLLQALAGRADRDGKGFVTVQDASRHVVDSVKLWASQANTSQTPTLQYTVAGDIVLTHYTREEP